ncbi:MAG: 2-phospho-L-lactate guanylyltransferase [Gammaproteobacteria bacterium]
MWAVVPLKSPERAKMRLAGVLSAAQRRELLFELAQRVIRALQATRGIEHTAIVTACTEVAAFARRLGVQSILQDTETGTAAAFAAAVDALQPRQLRGLLMLAGDLPLVSAAALERVIAAAGSSPGAVIVPDRHGAGTNALLCTPPQALAPCFGADSFRRHCAAAAASGLRLRVLDIPELALDLDDADDLAVLQRAQAELQPCLAAG